MGILRSRTEVTAVKAINGRETKSLMKSAVRATTSSLATSMGNLSILALILRQSAAVEGLVAVVITIRDSHTSKTGTQADGTHQVPATTAATAVTTATTAIKPQGRCS